MPEPYSVNDASSSQEHNPPSLAVSSSDKSLQPVAFLPLLLIMLGKPLTASLPPRGPLARTQQAASSFGHAWCRLVVASPGVGKTAGKSAGNVERLNYRYREQVWDDLDQLYCQYGRSLFSLHCSLLALSMPYMQCCLSIMQSWRHIDASVCYVPNLQQLPWVEVCGTHKRKSPQPAQEVQGVHSVQCHCKNVCVVAYEAAGIA